MIYPTHFEQKLGFDKIRTMLRGSTLCALGATRVDEMKFSTRADEIGRWLTMTDEMMRVLTESPTPMPTDCFYDMTDALKRLRLEGTFLEVEELYALRRSLATIADLVRFFNPRTEEGRKVYPLLQQRTLAVVTFPDLISRIDRILTPMGEMRDNASPALADIRRQLQQTVSSISRLLNSILRSAQSEGFVEKDVTPTLRDGRLVIPVAPANKRKIRGIVHDESATGKTLYVEPAEVVDANNRIRELEGEERQEIIRILSEVAAAIRPLLPDLAEAYDYLGEVDYIRAKAKFALRIEASVPTVDAEAHVTDWVQAYHPLLALRFRAEHKAEALVPLDIRLDDAEQRIILISGPNAGGKSVCLETLGLLQYMLQCGLPIPVRQNSVCTLYDSIFIDIGDEQSIENDLSTYSSHLTNMKYFVRNAGRRTLLLIDEFGSGTEPQIGGAIAQALLAKFNEAGAHGVITTHFPNLKQFAEDTPGIVNGAMLYDRHEMRPLFKLETGRPGSSFAIEIAHKIGLPNEVIEEAKRIVGSDYVNMDKYLQDVMRDKRYWEQKRQKIHAQEKRLEEQSAALEKQLAEVKAKRQEMMQAARDEAAKLLRDSNAKIEHTIRKIKEAQAEKEATRAVRAELTTFRDKIESQQQKAATPKLPRTPKGAQETPKEEPFRPGDAVRLKGQLTPGTVMSTNGRECVVAFGMIKSTVAADRLERVSKSQLKREQQQSNLTSGTRSPAVSDEIRERRLHFKQEIDVRGMRAEEALMAVTYYMDDAILLGISEVRILHGTGTGALRQVIRQYLATVPGVSSYHDEHVQFGGAGITVVELE
jgi:DNA mismatch repair protein MutS2